MEKDVIAVETYLYHYIVYCNHMWVSDDVCL
mgnify:CR=1 FL=1